MSSVFVDELLVEGEAVLKTDAALRKDFVEFIKGGAWTENLSSFEDFLSLPASSDSPWRKFAYGSPSHSANSIVSRSRNTSFEVAASPRSLSCDSGSGRASKSSPVYQKMVLEEFYGAIGDCELFDTEGLQAVLIAALLPQFLRSSEYKASTSTSMDEFDVPDLCVVNVNVNANRKPVFERPKSERLQEWLSGAAAMFDSSALETYLADPNSSWVDDYIRALKALPAVITVSVVDAEKKEASMVYSNAPSGGLLSSKNSAKSNILTAFCADMSLHDVERAGKAMFGAKMYKQGVLCSDGQCQLRALKPVFNTRGSYIYALSVESAHFEDPILPEKDKNNEAAAEKPFQQVDNLLLILPLLIRNFKTSPDVANFTRVSSHVEVA